ncbi:MAG TPA: hypothetical protein GX715_19145 [Armatimonadetes bacterium]|jgi:signal transduction histidine kinase|nr:hypothetical protein [Armatimonadota bacterium]
MRLLSFFGRFSTTDQMILGVLMVLFLGLVDYLSGWEVSILYLIPIAVVAWHGERWRGIVLSICCAVAWLIADLVWVSQPGAVPYWNAAVRLGIFLIISLTLHSLRIARERQTELIEFVVHDLRSPLTNVMAGLHLLADPDNETLTDTHREAGEIALISAERMKHLIDALLDISRMEGDRMPIRLTDVQPCQLADGALNQVSLWARNARVSIARDYPPDARPVRADRALIERVLVNLLGNAIRHSPPQTVITLRIANVGDAVAFSIIDQGPGIPAEWLSRIFDKFTQVAARKSGAAVGTGLGLTFCRHAVEAQDGRIGIESQEGEGTTVTVTLPAAPAEQADPMEGALAAGGR